MHRKVHAFLLCGRPATGHGGSAAGRVSEAIADHVGRRGLQVNLMHPALKMR
jgi:hypothetical protein